MTGLGHSLALLLAVSRLTSLIAVPDSFLSSQLPPQGPSPPARRLKVLVNNPAIAYSHVQYQGRLADLLSESTSSCTTPTHCWPTTPG